MDLPRHFALFYLQRQKAFRMGITNVENTMLQDAPLRDARGIICYSALVATNLSIKINRIRSREENPSHHRWTHSAYLSLGH